MTTPIAPLARIDDARRGRAAAKALVLLLAAGVLAACGGGGGGGGSKPAGTAASSTTSGGSTGGATGGSTGGATGGGVSDLQAFSQTVYPVLTQYCTACHSGFGPGFPNIAHPDVNTAYNAVVGTQKVNLANPGASRLVLRLDPEQHNCWSNCAADAVAMRTQVEMWASLVASGGSSGGGSTGGTGGSTGGVNTANGTITSATQRLADGGGANGGRVETNAIALYRFKEGSGNVAADTSGVAPAMDLTLTGTEWLSGGGIQNNSGSAMATAQASRKLFDRIAAPNAGSQQYTMEAWVAPANTAQTGPARIVTYSVDPNNRNFMMGQLNNTYVHRNRSRAAGIVANGTPNLQTRAADNDLKAELQHVVMTFDQTSGRKIYVNGVFTGDVDANGPGLMDNWNAGYTFVVGNERTQDRLFRGQFLLVAIHDRALTPAQVMQNFLAGVNETVVLRFSLEQWLGQGNFIEFEVSQFDPYSYEFCFPTFVSPNPNGIAVAGVRIAVNGTIPVSAQSFSTLNETVTEPRQRLSDLCTVVLKDRGPEMDQFSIAFEQLGANRFAFQDLGPNVVVDNSVVVYPAVGIRDFDQVNNTMASLTGVDPNNAQVNNAFMELRTALPTTTDVRSFVSAMQVAIQKLSLEYCDVLVDTTALRNAFFGTQFQFNQPVPTALANQAQRNLIIAPLADRVIQTSVANQPTRAEVDAVLNQLITELTQGCNATTCPAAFTQSVVKGVCSAALASAPVHLQ
jgi:hypothetical protein